MFISISTRSLLYFLIALQLIYTVASAPTKEVELESDLVVKSKPTKSDVDQFFKDQSHLVGSKQDGQSTTGGISAIEIPMIGTIGSLPFFGELNELMEMAGSLSPIGMPTPNSLFILTTQTPMEYLVQILGFRRTGRNETIDA